MTKTLQGNDHNSVTGVKAQKGDLMTDWIADMVTRKADPRTIVERAIADVFSAVEAIEVKEVGVEVNFVSGRVVARILTYDDRSVSSTKVFEVGT